MASPSKPIILDDAPVTTHEEEAPVGEARVPTPVPLDNEQLEPRDAAGKPYPEYNGGWTPRGSPKKSEDPKQDSDKDSSEVDPTLEPTKENSEEKDQDKINDGHRAGSPLPVSQQDEIIFTHSSGPLTPRMLAPPLPEIRSRKRKEEMDPSRQQRVDSTPSRPVESQDLVALHREMNMIMANTLKENDIRQMTINMQGQLSQLSGTITSLEGTLAKLQRQCQSTHGHVLLQDESFKNGIAKVEGDVRSSWISQARNRAAIAENGLAIKELDKNTTACHGLLKEIVARIPPPIHPFGSHADHTNWMNPTPPPAPQIPGPSDHGQALQNLLPALQQLIGQRPPEPPKKPKNPKKEPICAYCSAKHRSYECNVFFTWQDRRRLLITERGCLRCLQKNIDIANHVCDRKHTLCSQCRTEFHHCSVCDKQPCGSHDGQPPAKKPKNFPKKDSTKSKPHAQDK